MRRAYELMLEGGVTYQLRLTSFQLGGYLKSNFDNPTPPLVGVIQAIDRLDLLTDLLTRALRGGGELKLTGGELYDLLVDDGYCADDFAMLVVHIAAESGIIPADMVREYIDAVTEGANGTVGQARTVLEALRGQTAQTEYPGEAAADPTK